MLCRDDPGDPLLGHPLWFSGTHAAGTGGMRAPGAEEPHGEAAFRGVKERLQQEGLEGRQQVGGQRGSNNWSNVPVTSRGRFFRAVTTGPSFLRNRGLLRLSATFCFSLDRNFRLGSEAA